MKYATTTKGIAAATLGACMLAPGLAAAQAADGDDWQFRASLYGFLPDIGGSARFPTGGSMDIDVTADDIIDNLKFGGMASFEAQRGRWGAFVDVLHLNIGDSISDSRNLAAGSMPLPPGITADASLDVKATALTLAANYRVLETPGNTFDVFAGTRLLDGKGELKWAFNTDFGPFSGPARQGRSEGTLENWDAIVGIRGKRSFGSSQRWFMPFYADVGTGDSDLTWQASIGVGYAAGWGDVFVAYRHLDYGFADDSAIENLDFTGPSFGFAFSW